MSPSEHLIFNNIRYFNYFLHFRGPQYVQEMWAYMCPELLKAIEAEPESALVSEHLNALARCVEILGVGCLNDPSMEALVKIMIR